MLKYKGDTVPSFIELIKSIIATQDNKVDKVVGKGLSEAEFLSAEKSKLEAIAENANNYTHPDFHPVAIIDGRVYPMQFVKTDANGNTGFGYVNWSEITGKPADMDNVEFTTNRGVPNGYAPLGVNGKIDPSFLESLNIIDIFPTSDEASMLALAAAKPGDLAFRIDDQRQYMLLALPASTLANWKMLNSGGVFSVNGHIGAVVLSSDDISEGFNNLYYTDERVDDRVAALIQQGTNISIVYDDVTNTLTISADDVSVDFSHIQNTPTNAAGYGITDVYTKTQTDANISIAIAALTDTAPATLDTLNELAAALGDDPAFATTMTTLIGTKAPTANPVFTGSIGLPQWTTATRPVLGASDRATGFNTEIGIGETWNGVAWISSSDIAAQIHAAPVKTTPASIDELGFWDSVSGLLKKIGIGDFKLSLFLSPDLTGTPTINGISVVNFTKPFQGAPLFTKASVSTITIPIGTSVKAGVNIITVSGTAYTLSLNSVGVGALDTGVKAAGTDYYVYALEAGGFILSANATNPTGYTTANSRQIGGFHYGVVPEAFTAINNIVAADATKIAGINAYSFWDLKFRASNGDNRGMFKANTGKWYDLYLLNVDHHTFGTSAAGKTIAGGTVLNGRNFPKIPTFYGGNGTTTYGTLTWFEAAEIGKAYGKDMISYEEFCAIAYGVLEATSAGAADTGVTQHLANFTSKFGMCMATGCQWIWGKDIGNNGVASAWAANTEGRGSIYGNAASPVGARFGGFRDYTVESGSRASFWATYVWDTGWNYCCRYACNHLELA